VFTSTSSSVLFQSKVFYIEFYRSDPKFPLMKCILDLHNYRPKAFPFHCKLVCTLFDPSDGPG